MTKEHSFVQHLRTLATPEKVPELTCEYLKQCLRDRLPWVKDVELKERSPGQLDFLIKHSYPEGIHIASRAAPIVGAHVPDEIKWTVRYERVDPPQPKRRRW